MDRPAPIPRVAWHVDTDRPFRTQAKAYYAIAKALVEGKYPAWLHYLEEAGIPDGWTMEMAELRRERREALFYDQQEREWDPIWNEKKWKRFVWRVAKFIRFVDSRRGIAAQLDQLSDRQRNHELEYAERNAQDWMERARVVREYIAAHPQKDQP